MAHTFSNRRRYSRHNPLQGVLLACTVPLLFGACRLNEQTHSGEQTSRTVVNASPGSTSSFSQIYERVSPAVVSVNATRVAVSPAPIADSFSGTLGSERPVVQSMSSGSGFFISADGLLLTNNHVVGDAILVSVVLRDGRELPARVVGRDPGTDLAVLRVAGRGFPHLTFSAAANPRVGEAVIAIGNPFGLGTTATHGIVSAYGRNIGSPYVDFVQLDAPINQGNSGGPTFNEQGEVVGVNTAIFSPSGGSVGIGFAIPAATASDVAKQLSRSGHVERGFIGASIIDLQPVASVATGSRSGGAGVAAVVLGAPAHQAGLRPGDLITAIQGHEVKNATDVIRSVIRAEEGHVLQISILRKGRSVSINVPVQRRAS